MVESELLSMRVSGRDGSSFSSYNERSVLPSPSKSNGVDREDFVEHEHEKPSVTTRSSIYWPSRNVPISVPTRHLKRTFWPLADSGSFTREVIKIDVCSFPLLPDQPFLPPSGLLQH